MTGFKVVLTDHIYPDLEYEKEKLKDIGAELVVPSGLSEEEIIKEAYNADAVITCYTEITENIINSMEKCKSISKTGIGVNNINIAAANKKGIKVLNVPDYCIEEVSDHTVALILDLARRITYLNNNVKNGNWSFQEQRPMFRLKGSTLGLVGFGRIARLIGEKMKPFGMKTLVYDPFVNADTIEANGGIKVELEELLKQADFVSLNLPLTEETEKMINKDSLKLMKKHACIVNTSRGPLINEEDLYQALKNKDIAFAGLDVLGIEKYDPSNPLFSLDNIIITPHAAFYSVESTQELREKIIADVSSVLQGKDPKYQVNK